MVIKIQLMMYICHFIGDFFLQSKDIAKRKNKSYQYTCLHCLIYTFPFLLFLYIFQLNLMYVIGICLSHALIDLSKYWLLSHKIKDDLWVYDSGFLYGIDQILHCFIILLMTLLMKDSLIESSLIIYGSYQEWGICLYMVFFLRPAYITYKMIFHESIDYFLSINELVRNSIIFVLGCLFYLSYVWGLLISVFMLMIIGCFYKAYIKRSIRFLISLGVMSLMIQSGIGLIISFL